MPITNLLPLREWAPFQIDALGLVTMLGAEQADLVLGQLSRSAVAEYLPLLGAYVVANNHIVEPIPGFVLYNITDGISATDLAGWFCRWLLCQDLTPCASTIGISATSAAARREQRSRIIRHTIAATVGLLTPVPIVLSILIGDWWGLANGVAMLMSVAVRQVVLAQNRLALDHAADRKAKEAKKAGEAEKADMAKDTSLDEVKVLITTPNGCMVTVRTTRAIVIECLLTTPKPPNPRLYMAARAVGWAAFGAHLIALGMTTLFCQLLTVVLIVGATVLATRKVGVESNRVGQKLRLEREDDEVRFRAAAYARLELEAKEEQSMVQWNLFPHKTNESWWTNYYNEVKKDAGRRFRQWDQILGGEISAGAGNDQV